MRLQQHGGQNSKESTGKLRTIQVETAEMGRKSLLNPQYWSVHTWKETTGSWGENHLKGLEVMETGAWSHQSDKIHRITGIVHRKVFPQ